MQKTLYFSTLFALVASASSYAAMPSYQSNSSWYNDGQNLIKQKLNAPKPKTKAKNIILFIGDGMGISTQTAARILEGQQRGQTGEENQLSFEKFPYTALVKTYNTNQQTPDSAGTMTAMVTGVKTKAGVLSVSEKVLRSNCKSSKGRELTTILELAERKGKSTGVVSTARITHATPAATYAKTPERNWEDSSKLPKGAKCKDIADQLVNFSVGNGIDVTFGGGRRHFITKAEGGKRKDGRNLIQEWQNRFKDGTYVATKAQFDALKPAKNKRVLGLLAKSHMRYEADRKVKNDEPSLSEMTAKAIDILKQNKKGFFLMVESGRIDHGHHAGSAYNALTDTIEYAKAVQTAVNKTRDDDTLIIVTADHSHVFTIAGYPTRGNPILGKVVANDKNGLAKDKPELAKDNLPYTTLGYTNGRGFAYYANTQDADKRYDGEIATGRKNLNKIDTTSSGYHQEALIPLSSETHAAEDVAVFAKGPGAFLFAGNIEQNVIFHVMKYVGNL